MFPPRCNKILSLPTLFCALAVFHGGLCAQEAPAAKKSNAKPTAPAKSGFVKAALEPVKAAWEPVKTTAGAIADGAVVVGHTIKDGALMVRDFWGVMLPGEAERRRWVFDFEPKVGDVLKREFVRYPFLVHYNATERLEAYGGFTPVSPNPINSGFDGRWGLGQGTLGVRYDIPHKILFFNKTVVGFEVMQPMGKPPVDLIDHYTHMRPYVTMTCPFKPLPNTTFLLSTYYDKSLWSHQQYDTPPDHVRTDTIEVAPGFLYKPGQYGAVVQYGIQFLEQPDGNHVAHYAKLGGLWDIPESRSNAWHLTGKWQVEAGIKFSDRQSQDPRVGVYGRVKWKTDLFKRKWKEMTK